MADVNVLVLVIRSNPLAGVKLPRRGATRAKEALTVHQVEALAAEAGEYLYPGDLRLRPLVDGVHQQDPDAGDLSLQGAQHRVPKEMTADTFALGVGVNREPSEKHRRDRLGHVAADAPGRRLSM